MKSSFAALTCALLVTSPVVAQDQAPVPMAIAPAPTVAAVNSAAFLRVGTVVPLKLSEELTTKNKQVRVGQRFRLTTSEDIKVDGQVVIPVGSPAVGEITSVRNKGMWGKSGHIGAQLLYLQVQGRQIRLSGTFDDKGVTGTAGVVAAVVLIPLAGFFTTGTSANIPIGAGVKGFVDEDVSLAFAAQPPAPLQVAPASQPVNVPSSGVSASAAGAAAIVPATGQ